MTLHDLTIFQQVAYVMQDDALLPHLTVKETLTFAYRLRNGSRKDGVESATVNQLLRDLNLTHISDTRVREAAAKAMVMLKAS